MNNRMFYQKMADMLLNDGVVKIGTCLRGPNQGHKEFISEEYIPDQDVWVEELKSQIHVVVCGGGHISQALEKVLKTLDLHLTVLDDRAEFANRQRFALADEVKCVDFEQDFPRMSFGVNTYYVIVTRGHENDYLCLKQILQRAYDYIGMIGSKGKVKYAFDRLRDEGYTQDQIADVHAPIGLPLGGRTPAEIAISIAAEIIQVKSRQQSAAFPKEVMRGIWQEKGPCVMATIIDAVGSSPRGKGSRMLISANGCIYGTIGGGAIEGKVIKEALTHMGHAWFALEDFNLSSGQASNLGMVCGGRVKVMFEHIEAIEV